MTTLIVGAGLAGCIAAHLFRDKQVFEISEREDMESHKAVLRFRSDELSNILGVPFKKVKVQKRN